MPCTCKKAVAPAGKVPTWQATPRACTALQVALAVLVISVVLLSNAVMVAEVKVAGEEPSANGVRTSLTRTVEASDGPLLNTVMHHCESSPAPTLGVAAKLAAVAAKSAVAQFVPTGTAYLAVTKLAANPKLSVAVEVLFFGFGSYQVLLTEAVLVSDANVLPVVVRPLLAVTPVSKMDLAPAVPTLNAFQLQARLQGRLPLVVLDTTVRLASRIWQAASTSEVLAALKLTFSQSAGMGSTTVTVCGDVVLVIACGPLLVTVRVEVTVAPATGIGAALIFLVIAMSAPGGCETVPQAAETLLFTWLSIDAEEP